MTITRAVFLPGEDLHLLPGMVSPRLDQLLYLDDVDNGVTTTNRFVEWRPPGVTVTFEANFHATDARTAGVDVDPNFGEVTVDATLPAPERLLHFLVIATVSDATVVLATTRIRVRIHDALRAVWLTPNPLAARLVSSLVNPRGSERLTVLAEFDDGQYGDLSNWHPRFSTDPPDPTDRRFARTIAQRDVPVLQWRSSDPNTVFINQTTGLLICLFYGSVTIFLESPTLPGISATATVAVHDPWNERLELHLVEGPGFGRMTDAANILFLPEGFTDDEQGDFERIVRQIVHRLRARRRTRPFDLLKDRINYWTAWVASPDSGVSVLEEVEATTLVSGPTTVTCVPTHVPLSRVVSSYLIGVPAQNATRFLLNERSTAFHVALGGRPSADPLHTFRWPRLNDRRVARFCLDDFFEALFDPRRPADVVGKVWMRPVQPVPANPDPLRGKDQARVVFVCRYLRSDANNVISAALGSYVCLSFREGDEHAHAIEPTPTLKGLNLVPDPIPPRIALELPSVCAHELCHGFSLGDEYGSDYPGRTRTTPLVLPADKLAEVRQNPNIQARVDLLTNGTLDADRIKWLWPRIEKAGVLAQPAGPLRPGGDPWFHLLLEPGQTAPFAVGDVLRLRHRPLATAGPPSFRLRVADVQGDELLVEADVSTPDAEAQLVPYHVKGTLVMAPVRAPDVGAQRGDDLLLAHESALDAIDDGHNPLNALPGDAADRPCTDVLIVNTPTAATLFDDPPRPPRHSGLRVGLYENGATYDAEVYRPTGMCFMRTSRTLTDEDQVRDPVTSADQRLYQRFCPVCRYVLVDLIDPTQHGRIDRDYGRVYPR